MKQTLELLINPVNIDIEKIPSLLEHSGMRTRNTEKLKAAISKSICVIAVDSKQLVGFGRLITDYVYYGSVWDVAVLASHRRLGVGSQIITALLTEARKLDLHMIGLVTDVGNRSFYESIGFDFLPKVHAMRTLIK